MDFLLYLWHRRYSVALALALLIYAALALGAVREVGVVGEVAIGQALDAPPAVLVEIDPPRFASGVMVPSAGHRWGPLVLSQVRPVELLELGPLRLPLAINSYTGGPPDWPARAIFALTGSMLAVRSLHIALGALLIIGVHRLLRAYGSDIAASIAALVLATDAGFLFYRKALGGTELVLCAAGLLCFSALWSRRWSGATWGVLVFGVGVGLGLLAKVTFVITLVALGTTAALMRWDRPALRPPLPQNLWAPAVAVVGLTAPLWITAIHVYFGLDDQPRLRSHDFAGLQSDRVLRLLSLDAAPARESWNNLMFWAGDLYAFFGPAYGAEAPPTWSPWRIVAWIVAGTGALLGWRRRTASVPEALLRFLGVFLVLQVGLLLLVGRDLHHMGQASPTLAMVVGLGLERLAAVATPARSFARARTALLLALPWLATGIAASWRADATLRTIPVATFTTTGQRALLDLLRQHEVRRLVLCDYESYGMLEIGTRDWPVPPVIENAWGASSRAGQPGQPSRDALLDELLRRARGGHLLVVRPSAPMIYNLTPSAARLRVVAERTGTTVTAVGALPQDSATLYRVD